jgi:hypothetical protein
MTGQIPMKAGVSPYDVAAEYFPKLRVSKNATLIHYVIEGG